MKLVSLLLTALAATNLSSDLLAANSPNKLDLDGREVVVRVYEDVRNNPAAYETTTVKVADRKITFDLENIDDASNTVVVVPGQDQTDEVIRQLLRCETTAWVYRKGMQWSLPDEAPESSDEELMSWTFLDGLGNPIPDAKVQVYFVPEQRRVLIEKGKLDEQGYIKAGFCVGIGSAVEEGLGIRTGWPAFIISHPEYGTGWIEPFPCGMPYVVYAPLVPRRSEAYERCIWGVVMDPDNQPISGALVRCEALYPPGGEKVDAARCQRVASQTNQQGRFRLYLPVEESSLQIGMVIPPDTKYSVKIEPPEGLDMLPFEGQILNGRETKVTLERAGYFRTFIFEDENGRITDLKRLRYTYVTIKSPGKADLTLNYNDWKGGGKFPLGRFEARYRRRGHLFQPLEVTAKSPTQLVFKMSEENKAYYGQVVNGVTGKPINGAFAIDFKLQHENADLSPLTADQWKALHALPAAVSTSEKPSRRALGPVRGYYWFERMARTDANGWFEMNLPVKSSAEQLIVFEQDYLGAKVPLSSARPDDYGGAELPVTKLFPAAKVIFEPWLEQEDKKKSIRILREWFVDKQNSPRWAKDLVGWCSREEQVKTRKGFGFYLDEELGFYVPSGLNLRIQFRMWDEYMWSPTAFAEVGKLRQGQVVKLTRQQIQPAVSLLAEVLNSAGKPVEGVPVQACDQYSQVTHNTDANGIVMFDLAQDSKGEFVVACKPADEPNAAPLREAIPYRISSEEDPNIVYTLQVSDEILNHLFK